MEGKVSQWAPQSAPGGPEPSAWDYHLQIQLGPQTLKPSRRSQRMVEPLSWKRTSRLPPCAGHPASSLYPETWPTQEWQNLKAPTPGVHPNPCPSSRWCHPAISSSVVPFPSCPQSLPALGSFPMSQLFKWGGQSTGVSASASVLPVNTQDWSPLGWTGWISLQSKGLSRVFSNTTVQKHQFFGAQLSLQSNSHIHTWPLEKPLPWLDGPLLAK